MIVKPGILSGYCRRLCVPELCCTHTEQIFQLLQASIDPIKTAKRLNKIQPFHVMEILAKANHLQQAGRDIVHLEIGEADFSSPLTVIAAGIASLQDGLTHYTPALGLPQLRQAVADYYRRQFAVSLSAERIAITTGASGGLLLLCALLIDPGDEVLLADPGYPCYRHFVSLFGGIVKAIPVTAQTGYQLTASLVQKHWSRHTTLVITSSPSNPTGTTMSPTQVKEISHAVQDLGGILIADEIYQGLVYTGDSHTALSQSENVLVVNSFSKFFGMTGWRLGWCVLPPVLLPDFEKLAQNFFLSAPSCSQYAALAAFTADTLRELEHRRQVFKARRDFLVPELRRLGFQIAMVPQGAFYIYADCSNLAADSQQFVEHLLVKAGVAITPGLDFGTYQAEKHVRITYTQSIEHLEVAIARMESMLHKNS